MREIVEKQRPFQKNEELVITIEDMTNEGEGIGRANGYALFVKNTLPGEVVKVRIMKAKKNYGYARLVELITPSVYRVDPKCPVARQCGGCQLQHMEYKSQLAYKENKVKKCLERIGGFADIPMEPIIGMDEPYHYRNKAQFPVRKGRDGKPVIGFYAERTHHIIDHSDCLIQAKVNHEIIGKIRAYMEQYKIEPYDEHLHTGLVRHILTRVGYETGEIMVCLVINGTKIPYCERMVESLLRIKGIKSICYNVNREKTNVILGEKIISLWGETYITDYIGEIKYRISPLSFYQVNPIQTKKLYETALQYASLTERDIVWDLYCGIGTISLYFAKYAKRVYGVEIVSQAIEDAKVNTSINTITNAEFFVGAAEVVLPEKYKESNGVMKADVIVVDPPRKGCEKALLQTIVDMEPERVVYVSCDPATLARDLKFMCMKGYELKRVRPCDMFGMGVHVETVCLLSKLRTDHHIEVNLNMDELDLTSAESKATYEEIKEYVLENSGLKVSSLYIAQVKEKMGIKERENYNHSKKEDANIPRCPADKEKAIVEALKHFNMID